MMIIKIIINKSRKMESLSNIVCNCNRLIEPLSRLYQQLYNEQLALDPDHPVDTRALLRRVETINGGKLSDCCREKIFNPAQIKQAFEPQWDIISGVKSMRIGQEIPTENPKQYRRYVGDNTTVSILPTRVYNLTGVLLKNRTPAEQARIDNDIKYGEPFTLKSMEFNPKTGLYRQGDEKGLPIVEWNQRRMLIMEIMFLAYHVRDRTNEVIYLGQPEKHLQILKSLFPEKKFTEYTSDDVKLVNKAPNAAFICQYRTNDSKYDMYIQREWYNKIQPLESLLRFVIPGYERCIDRPTKVLDTQTFRYLDGKLYFEPWSSVFNCETSLIPIADSEKIYIVRDYQDALTYHNFTTRPNLIKYRNPFLSNNELNKPIGSPELLNDYDSTDEVAILIGLYKLQQKINKLTLSDITKISTTITQLLDDNKVTLESLRKAAIATGPSPREKRYYIGSEKSLGALFGKTIEEPGKTVVTSNMMVTSPVIKSITFDAKSLQDMKDIPLSLKIEYDKLCVSSPGSIINSLKPSQLTSFAKAMSTFGLDEKNVLRVANPVADIGVDTLALRNVFYNASVVAVESNDSEYQCLLTNVKAFKNIIVVKSTLTAWFSTPQNYNTVDLLYLKPDITVESLNQGGTIAKIKFDDREYDLFVIAESLAQTIKNIVVRVPSNYNYDKYKSRPHVQIPVDDKYSDVLILFRK
jgi:hypothetical protein